MTTQETHPETDASFAFRMGPGYVTWWMHNFEHWKSSDSQLSAVRGLEDSLKRLMEMRDQVQMARGPFGRVSSFYPNSHPTSRQQDNLFHATHDFFNAYYSAVSAFSTLVKRHRDVFGDSPNNSVSKFLTWWKPKGIFMDEAHPVLESARAFRAMFAHAESRPPYDWHTAKDEGFTKIVLIGPANRNGEIPDGAEPFPDSKWAFLAPDEDLVVSALTVQLNAAIPAIQTGKGRAKAMRCTWDRPASPDDVTLDYPIFAHRAGTLEETYVQTVRTEVVVRNAAGEEIHIDDEDE